MIARAWRQFRVWRDARAKRIRDRVVSDEALRLLRLVGTVDEAVTTPPPRPQGPEAALQMDEAEVAALIEAVRSDPMWGHLRQESRKLALDRF